MRLCLLEHDLKASLYLQIRQALLSLYAADTDLRHRSSQVEGKIPKALALAPACVRLWTPSLP
jgi:hypothetical protein